MELENKIEQAGAKIHFGQEYAVEGFAVLLSHGQVGCLPADVYVVSQEHLALLGKAGIPYERLDR